MSTESNKHIVRSLMQMLERGDTENVDKIFSPNWVNHDPSLPPLKGIDGARQLLGLWTALSDRKVVIEDSIAEGDRVAIHFSFGGKHTGTLMGIAPTGKTVNLTGTGIFKVVDGKLTDNWVNFDALGMLQQLGVAPKQS